MSEQRERAWDYGFECEIDTTGALRLTRPDSALADRLAISPEDLTRVGSWMAVIPPEDIARSLTAIQQLAQGQPWEGPVRLAHMTGDGVVILRVKATPERLGDGRVRVDIQGRDVTETVRLETTLAVAQARLRLLDEGLSLALWTTDNALRFTQSSGSILGDVNSLVGTSLYDWFEPADPKSPPIAAHLRAVAGDTATYDVDWEGGRLRVLLEPMRDEVGNIAGVIGVGVDLNALVTRARRPEPSLVVRARHDSIHPAPNSDSSDEVIWIGDLSIDPKRFEVLREGEKIPLTLTEFNLLKELARQSGVPLSRRMLAERVWGHAYYAESAAVTMAISRLRDKIDDDPASPAIIETVRGIGYRVVDGNGSR